MLLNNIEDLLYFEHLVAFPSISALKINAFQVLPLSLVPLMAGLPGNTPAFPRLSRWLWCTYAPKTPPRGSVRDSHTKHVSSCHPWRQELAMMLERLPPPCMPRTYTKVVPTQRSCRNSGTDRETDFALWASNVTEQAFGWALSTLVVQERYLWLNLAEMRDAEK